MEVDRKGEHQKDLAAVDWVVDYWEEELVVFVAAEVVIEA